MEETRIGKRNADILGLRPIGRMPKDPARFGAVRKQSSLAVVAVAAVADTGYQHRVAFLVAQDATANAVDGADAFMADGDALLAGRDVSLEDMEVGAADGGVFDFDDGVGRFFDFGFGLVL